MAAQPEDPDPYTLDFPDESLPLEDVEDVDDDPTHIPGATLGGRYELVTCMGRGGMGAVWEAIDHTLQSRVAVKVVRARVFDYIGSTAKTRILREARAAASITHPGIVRTFDVGTEEGRPYIVMELLEGQSLEELLDDRGRLIPVDAVRVVIPLLRALGCAHEQGVVHRDIKPSNVMLVPTDDGSHTPKLLDFGIARQMGEDQRITQTGQLLGTPAYMSYEQATGTTDVDARSDLWAVAALTYELVSGLPPFDGENYNAVLTNILMHRYEPLNRVMKDVDAQLAAIVARGLEPNRDDRWSSAAAMIRALEAWLLDQGIGSDITGRAVSNPGALPVPAARRRTTSVVPTLAGLPVEMTPRPRTLQRPVDPTLVPERGVRTTLEALEAPATQPTKKKPWHLLAAAALALTATGAMVAGNGPRPMVKAGLAQPMLAAASNALMGLHTGGRATATRAELPEEEVAPAPEEDEETAHDAPAPRRRHHAVAAKPSRTHSTPSSSPSRPASPDTTWAGGVPLPTRLR